MNYTVILRRPESVGDDYKTVIQHVALDRGGLDVADHVEWEARKQQEKVDEEGRPGLLAGDYTLVAIFAGHHVAMAVGD